KGKERDISDLELRTPSEAAADIHPPASLFHVVNDGVQNALLRVRRDHYFSSIGFVSRKISCAFLQHRCEHYQGSQQSPNSVPTTHKLPPPGFHRNGRQQDEKNVHRTHHAVQ